MQPNPFGNLSPGYHNLPAYVTGPVPDLDFWQAFTRPKKAAGKGPIEGGMLPGGRMSEHAYACLRDLGCRTHNIMGGVPTIYLFTPGYGPANVIPELQGHG